MNVTDNHDGTKTVQLRLEARPGADGWVRGGVVLDGEFIELARVTRPPYDNDDAVEKAFIDLVTKLAVASVRTAVGDKAADSVQVLKTTPAND